MPLLQYYAVGIPRQSYRTLAQIIAIMNIDFYFCLAEDFRSISMSRFLVEAIACSSAKKVWIQRRRFEIAIIHVFIENRKSLRLFFPFACSKITWSGLRIKTATSIQTSSPNLRIHIRERKWPTYLVRNVLVLHLLVFACIKYTQNKSYSFRSFSLTAATC